MKKLLLSLSILAISAISTQTFAAPMCGCETPPKNDCDTPKCEQCRELAETPCSKDKYDQYMDEYFCRLNLDSCQQKEADCIKEKYRQEMDAITEKIKSDKDCLCALIKAACIDKSAIRSQEKVLRQDCKDLKATIKKINKEIKPILNKEQKSEYRKLNSEIRYRIKKEMKYCCKKH